MAINLDCVLYLIFVKGDYQAYIKRSLVVNVLMPVAANFVACCALSRSTFVM